MHHPIRSLSSLALAAVVATTSVALMATPTSAVAAAAPQKVQVPGYYHMAFGPMQVTALYDGYVDLAPKLLKGASAKTLQSLMARMFQESTKGVQTAVNGFLVNTGDHLVLVDTGAAGCFGPTLGNIAANLKASGYKLEDVDAVLLIIEHGDYPTNKWGQIVYPRYELFQELVNVFRKSGRSVPVFVDKHLSYDHRHAAEMVATAKELKFGLMAGSSLPVTWRLPEFNPPLGTPFEEGVAVIGYDRSNIEIYLFHVLEVLQCMMERRPGGETGVKSVQCLSGNAVWKAGDEGRWSWSLLDHALSRCPSLNYGKVREQVKNPLCVLIEYADGTKGTAFNLVEAVSDFAFAGKIRDRSEPVSTCFYLPAPPGARFFDPLTYNIEQFFATGRSPYPVERTLLTSTICDHAMHSYHDGSKVISDPSLSIRYHPPIDDGHFRGTFIDRR